MPVPLGYTTYIVNRLSVKTVDIDIAVERIIPPDTRGTFRIMNLFPFRGIDRGLGQEIHVCSGFSSQ